MKPLFISTFALTLVLTTTTCGSSMNPPHIKHNPHPKMRYEITLTIKDTPGPFDSAEGYMSYEIINEQCAPFEKFAGIYHTPPSQHPSFSLSRISNNDYKGIFYLDFLLDEDYYGLGVCRWKPTNIGAQLKAGKMAFSPYISVDQVLSQQPSVQHFYRNDYHVDTSSDGVSSPSILGKSATEYLEQHPELRFEIMINTKELFE